MRRILTITANIAAHFWEEVAFPLALGLITTILIIALTICFCQLTIGL